MISWKRKTDRLLFENTSAERPLGIPLKAASQFFVPVYLFCPAVSAGLSPNEVPRSHQVASSFDCSVPIFGHLAAQTQFPNPLEIWELENYMNK